MTVTIDRDGCIGCGVCEQVCPDVFRMADDGLAEVYAQPDESMTAAVTEAVESCPVSVISAEV